MKGFALGLALKQRRRQFGNRLLVTRLYDNLLMSLLGFVLATWSVNIYKLLQIVTTTMNSR